MEAREGHNDDGPHADPASRSRPAGWSRARSAPASALAATCNPYGGGSCGSADSVATPTSAVSSRSSDNGAAALLGVSIHRLSLIGIGAVAGGTALVRSGRRKAVGG